jgi:hypothetical protein
MIDGSKFNDFEGFTREFSSLLTDYVWHGNLNAFNDILRGGFGTPEGGFVLRWTNSDRSRKALGWPETIKRFEENLERCHPINRDSVLAELETARRNEGQTLFDAIVEIIGFHGPGGHESDDGVDLRLE